MSSNSLASEIVDSTSKKDSLGVVYSQADITSSKNAYHRSLDLSSSLNQSIETLYSNNVKASNIIHNLQIENQMLKDQLTTLQDTVRKINNNLFQMQQRLESQAKSR